jgi:hypothetical protein
MIEYLENLLWTEPVIIASMILIIGSLLILSHLWSSFSSKRNKGDKGEKNEDETKEVKEVDLKKALVALDFLNKIIKEKYNYYMYLDLLPVYIEKKIPEKKLIDKTKNKIYVSVVGSLSRSVKFEILNYFTEKGIEIYVNERIIILMNETDFESTEKYGGTFRNISPSNVQKLL